MILFRKAVLERGDATIFFHRFRSYNYTVEFKECSVIASVRTYDEALKHIEHVDDYRQKLVMDKLKTK